MNLLGGLRETGDLPLFSPKGRTYSPPRRHKLHILCPAASGRSHPFRCASFSHKVNDFVGALLRRWYALRHRALSEGDFAFCGKRQTMPQHLRALLSSSARLGKYRRFNRRYFSNRLRKPATGSFAAEMDGRSARPFSLLRKRNRKKKTR